MQQSANGYAQILRFWRHLCQRPNPNPPWAYSHLSQLRHALSLRLKVNDILMELQDIFAAYLGRSGV